MERLTLKQANKIVDSAIEKGRELKLKPLAVVVLDDRGTVKVCKQEDGTAHQRFEVSHGKAFGTLGMGSSSRNLERITNERPTFATALMSAFQGRLSPGAGGVLIQNDAGDVIGAVGVSGDKADNDEACAFAGIVAADLKHPNA